VSNERVSIDSERALSLEQYRALADVPPEVEWLANISNPKTRRFYKSDVGEFMAFTGLRETSPLRSAARAHLIARRDDMKRRSLGAETIRRKLSALSSLFDYLCERNAVPGSAVDGVKRPVANNNEGSVFRVSVAAL
jgi:integrase/recombinase XerD